MGIIGIIGILVGLIFFLVMVYKGYFPLWVAAISAIIIAVTNLLSPADTINSFAGGLADLCSVMLPVVLGGVLMGRIFTVSGASTSVAKFLTEKFVLKASGEKQVKIAIVVCFVFCGLCTMGGIDGYVLMFTFCPIVMIICEAVDIPRRFAPAMLACATPFCATPGAPQIYNIMAEASVTGAIMSNEALAAVAGPNFDISPWAAPIPGFIAIILIIILGYFTLTKMIIKAKRNDEHFEYGPVVKMTGDPNRKLPKPIVAILPLVAVFFIYTVIPSITPIREVPVLVALGAGIGLNLLLMAKYIPKVDKNGNPTSLGKAILGQVDEGTLSLPQTFINITTPAMLAGVITSTAAFGMIVGLLSGWQVSYAVLSLVVVCIIVAITSSPPAALMVALPIAIGVMLGQGYAPAVIVAAAPGIVRIGALAALTFETLPFNGSILLGLNLCHTSHKESYKAQFMVTVLWTLVGAIVATALIVAVPSLGQMQI